MNLAPIVLFVYNRPWHTKQTLDALKQNDLAQETIIYIYVDGPKLNAKPEDIEKTKEVRNIIKNVHGFSKVVVKEATENKGLAKSVLDGVSEVIDKFGKIIVLEDDIVTSPGFLRYMNDALNFYENEEKVMHISAYSPPVKQKLPELFFYEVMHCWGWGTWKRAWKKLNTSYTHILKILKEDKRLSHFDLDNSGMFLPQLHHNIIGKSNTWAILWYGSIYLANGLCLNPGTSLIQNIGHDGSGVNSLSVTNLKWDVNDYQSVYGIEIKSCKKARKIISQHYRYGGESKLRNIYNKMKGKIYRNLKPFISSK